MTASGSGRYRFRGAYLNSGSALGYAGASKATTPYPATKDDLVSVFGCPKRMFENIHKIAWLKDARTVTGRGGKKSLAPKYDPALFVENLPGSIYGNHLTRNSACAELERHFGDRYAELSSRDPQAQAGRAAENRLLRVISA